MVVEIEWVRYVFAYFLTATIWWRTKTSEMTTVEELQGVVAGFTAILKQQAEAQQCNILRFASVFYCIRLPSSRPF